MSTLSNENRRDAITKSLEDYRNNNLKRTETIDYRGTKRSLEVITLPITLLLLNHDNSRLTAQLVDHPKKSSVELNPFSEETQSIIASLLRSTESFKTLLEELKKFGQQNPGLISRDGLLINGNTRLVALREIGAQGIDVAVLPEDALASDFLDVEMSLQMQKLTHQDYTFTNRLLLMKRYLDRGHTKNELGAKMGWVKNVTKKVDQNIRLLNLIDEIRSQRNSHFPYEFFDNKEQVLKDLDDEYQRLLNGNAFDEAESMKWTRISGMLLGVSKDQVRAMDELFLNDEVFKRLEGKSEIISLIQSTPKEIKSDDLDQLLGNNHVSNIDVKGFAKKLIKEMVTDSGTILPELSEPFEEIRKQMRISAEDVINQQRLSSYLAEPAEKLREARIDIENIKSNIGEIAAQTAFKPGEFEYELKRISKAVTDLLALAKKYL